MNDIVTIWRSPVEGIYIVREDEEYWMVNDDGVAYGIGRTRPEFPEILAFVHRTLVDRMKES